jgi:hypothetical protein
MPEAGYYFAACYEALVKDLRGRCWRLRFRRWLVVKLHAKKLEHGLHFLMRTA